MLINTINIASSNFIIISYDSHNYYNRKKTIRKTDLPVIMCNHILHNKILNHTIFKCYVRLRSIRLNAITVIYCKRIKPFRSHGRDC